MTDQDGQPPPVGLRLWDCRLAIRYLNSFFYEVDLQLPLRATSEDDFFLTCNLCIL